MTNTTPRPVIALAFIACILTTVTPEGASDAPPTASPAPAALAPSPASEVLSLDQAVALALESNRDVKNAALDVVKAASELGAFRTQVLPSFNLYAIESQTLDDIKVRVPSGAFGDFPATGPIPAADSEVTTPAGRKALILGQVSQPLTQLRRVGLGVGLKRANLEIARERLRAQRQATVNDVRRAYYSLLQTQSALRAEEESLTSLRELDRVVGNQVTQRVELEASGLEVKAHLARAEYDALTYRNGLLSGRERLNQILGRSIDIPFNVDPVPDVSPFESDLEAARAAALAHRADLREARQRQRQADLDHRIKKWDFVPDLSLTYSYLSLPDVELLPKRITSVGFLLSWEPFDWGRRRQALAQARASAEQGGNSVQQAESLAAVDVGLKFRHLQEARVLVEATRLAHEAARGRLEVTMKRYAQKAVLLKDVLEDQERLADAQRTRDEALLSAWTARADLEKALGED
jgi:outer membrane protein